VSLRSDNCIFYNKGWIGLVTENTAVTSLGCLGFQLYGELKASQTGDLYYDQILYCKEDMTNICNDTI